MTNIYILSLALFASFAIAEDDYDSCTQAISTKSTECTTASQLPSGAAQAFKDGQNAVCDLNYHAIENVNHMLCFIKYKMKFDGTASGSADVEGVTYAWEYSTSGLEAFATALGYTGKIVLKKDSITQATMWFDGTGDSSKGYLISNKFGITLSNELAIYIQWDKSGDAQWARYIRGTWDATTNTNGPMDGGNANISRGKYGYMSYNKTTDKITELEVTDVKTNGGSLACERQRIWGGRGDSGTLGIWYSSGEASTGTQTNHSVGSGTTSSGTYTVSTGLSAGSLSDFDTTVDSVTGPGAMSKACADVYATRSGGASALFGTNADNLRVTFTKTPTDVFGGASPSR